MKGRTYKPAVDTVSQIIIAPREAHSRKPVEVYERIEAMYPDLTKAELFARQVRPGWQAIGNEIDGKDIRQSLAS